MANALEQFDELLESVKDDLVILHNADIISIRLPMWRQVVTREMILGLATKEHAQHALSFIAALPLHVELPTADMIAATRALPALGEYITFDLQKDTSAYQSIIRHLLANVWRLAYILVQICD
jgi:hypothetical protein